MASTRSCVRSWSEMLDLAVAGELFDRERDPFDDRLGGFGQLAEVCGELVEKSVGRPHRADYQQLSRRWEVAVHGLPGDTQARATSAIRIEVLARP